VPRHKGLTVFLVPLDLPGVEIRPIRTLGGERTNFVHFDDVRIADEHRLGGVNDGWAVVSVPLAAEHGMGDTGDDEESGGRMYAATLQKLFDLVIGQLRSEVGASGAARIDDPLVRTRLARVAVDLELATVTPGPMGRILAAEVLIRDAADLLEMLGPAALLSHGTPGAVADGFAEYAYRFAPGTAIYGGSTDIHRNMVAQQVLGLPRSTPRAVPRHQDDRPADVRRG
jgi:alkylation response protein AidB-like acyl-CoA dehydrogenase